MTTDITELARERLKEKFDVWFEREYKHLESSKYTDAVPHIKYGFWTAYQAGGAELVEALEKAQSAGSINNQWKPDVCPITGRRFFLWIEHPELGYVPTYGGPYDSYTIPTRDSDGEFSCERYDHDVGGWVDGECVGTYLIDDDEQSRVYELEQRIAELEESHAQVIQSRDHYKRMTEEGLKQLAESRTVKLVDINEFLADVHDKTLALAFRRLAEGVREADIYAMRAAGIKWEDE